MWDYVFDNGTHIFLGLALRRKSGRKNGAERAQALRAGRCRASCRRRYPAAGRATVEQAGARVWPRTGTLGTVRSTRLPFRKV